jgi:hypothetical protein
VVGVPAAAGALAMWNFIGATVAHMVSILAALDWMQWILLWSLGFIVFVLWRCQVDPKDPTDLRHLYVDPATGRLDRFAFAYVVGLVIMSWVILTNSVNGKLTEWMLFSYVVYCGAPKSIDLYLSKKASV